MEQRKRNLNLLVMKILKVDGILRAALDDMNVKRDIRDITKYVLKGPARYV